MAATKKTNLVTAYNLPVRHKLVYQKHLYELPEHYALIQNVNAVYVVVIEQRALKVVLDDTYAPVDVSLKLDCQHLELGLYVLELVRQSKNFLLTDVFVINDVHVTSPHWCVRWALLANVPIPKIRALHNAKALRYDVNTAKGQVLVRSVVHTTTEHFLNNDKPQVMIVYGVGVLEKSNVPVSIVAGNLNGNLVPVAYFRKPTSTFYEQRAQPDIKQVQQVQQFLVPRLVHVKHLDLGKRKSKLVELQTKNVTVYEQKFEQLQVDPPLILFNDQLLTRLDETCTNLDRDLAATKKVIEQHQALAVEQCKLNAQYLEQNLRLL